MPAVKRKSSTVGKRKKRTIAAKPTPTRKKAAKRGKKKAATGVKTTRRRKSVGAKKATRKPRRRKTVTRKKPATRRKTARGKTKKKAVSRVKKKPSESKTSKKTSTSSRVSRSRKPIAKKKSIKIAKAQGIRAPSKKKQQQARSDSQALPAVEQQPSLETKMAEHKKPKKASKKQRSLPETRLELTSIHSGIDLDIAPYKERPGEDYMNASQQSYFRRLLLQRRCVLLEDMGKTVHHLQDEATPLPDMSDRATQEEEFSLELRARDRERKLIKKIEDALQQLDEGHYGFCNACGVEIGIRRLEARPTANLCIDCKTLDEIREKQTGG
jgi:RNA polymerase-binding transcription factor